MATTDVPSDVARRLKDRRPRNRYLLAVGLMIMLAGFLFGYDQGVISGALDGIQKDFRIGSVMLEIITSWVTLGAMAGALVAGEMADRLGRRTTILVAAATFVVGALIEAMAPGSLVLVLGRLIVGAGVGVASVAAPLYGAEVAPARLRGRYVSLYQMAITIGIFLAYFADYLLISSNGWRVMLGISAVPAGLLVIVAWPLKDTPRWYVKVGRTSKAAEVLRKTEPDSDIDQQLAFIEEAVVADGQSARWREIFARKWQKPLFAACALAVLQQLTGINAIIYYADKIFAAAGFETPKSQSLATLFAVGAVNVVATLVAVLWVDRFGRKPLLLIGSSGMFISLVVVAGAFFSLDHASHHSSGTSTAGIVALIGLVAFIACFAFSLGPVVWIMINEIFPGHVRARGVALATAVNWLAAFVVAEFYLSLVSAITTAGTFLLFAGFCAITFVYVRWFLPETKGKSLEEVQTMWSDSDVLREAIAAS